MVAYAWSTLILIISLRNLPSLKWLSKQTMRIEMSVSYIRIAMTMFIKLNSFGKCGRRKIYEIKMEKNSRIHLFYSVQCSSFNNVKWLNQAKHQQIILNWFGKRGNCFFVSFYIDDCCLCQCIFVRMIFCVLWKKKRYYGKFKECVSDQK